MINIQHKEDCVGCNACTQKCPKSCISMHEDEEGFLYPKVDESKCINCGLCEKVCPVLNPAPPRIPKYTYAATNTNKDEKYKSSSGGVFIVLAKKIIEEGGVVFGAKFNEQWEVVHGYAETIEDAKVFQSSKYVQSRIGTAFKDAETFLKAGRKVMFTGTPCQLKGLGLFLRKDYGDQLLKVDIVCHGVPSPLVWREYLKYVLDKELKSDSQSTISNIIFRDKRVSWNKYGFSIKKKNSDKNDVNTRLKTESQDKKDNDIFYQPQSENLYMNIFLNDLDLRPSCYSCPAKSGKSCSDLTLGDFWGIQKEYPELYEEGKYSLLLEYSDNASLNLENEDIDKTPVDFEIALKGNPSICRNSRNPKYRTLFWTVFNTKGIEATSKVLNKFNPSLLRIIVRKGRKIISKLF